MACRSPVRLGPKQNIPEARSALATKMVLPKTDRNLRALGTQRDPEHRHFASKIFQPRTSTNEEPHDDPAHLFPTKSGDPQERSPSTPVSVEWSMALGIDSRTKPCCENHQSIASNGLKHGQCYGPLSLNIATVAFTSKVPQNAIGNYGYVKCISFQY